MSNRTVDISLSEVFAAFGNQEFNPQVAEIRGYNDLQRVTEGKHGSPYYQPEVNGTETFLPVLITYARKEGTLPDGESVELNKTISLPHPVIAIRRKKRFIRTPLTERDGDVVELINSGNYEIVVRGIIVNEDNELPEEDIDVLRELQEQKKVVSISNVITDLFLLRPDRSGSDHVIIEDFNLMDIRGVKHVRHYELVMFSDLPFNLIEII